MKRAVSLILLLSLLLFSCADSTPDVIGAAYAFRDAFCPSGRVYFSSAEEGGEGYAPALIKEAFFEEDIEISEWALVLCSGLDTVGEFGILVSPDTKGALDLYSACLSRIELFSIFSGELGSFILRRGRSVIYGVFPDAEAARSRIIRILRT